MGELVSLRRKFKNSSLEKKRCSRCNEEFPRTDQYFYTKKHHSRAGGINYYADFISCNNKRSAKFKASAEYQEKRREKHNAYRQTERGYFMELWSGVYRSRHGCEFKNFEEFFNCWIEQQKTYGTRCPYLNIEMTKIKGKDGTKTKTNISKDRINSNLPYSRRNLMFCSWKANDMKGSVTPKIAKRYLGFYKERFGHEH